MLITVPLSLMAYPFAALLCYFPCFNGGPIFDDIEVLRNVEHYTGKWKYLLSRYRTLTLASYAMQKFWPGTMRSLHIVNALIHSLNGMLLAQIATTLGFDEVTAFLAGLLYTIHPFAANTVSYITGRASILSTTFGLLAVWALLTPGQSHWALLPLGLSLLCKEDGLGFVPLLLALSAFTDQWFFFAVLFALSGGFTVWKWPDLKRYRRGNGDGMMKAIGLPVSLPSLQQGYVILVETMIRLPLWAFGLAQSPYHGSGVQPSLAKFFLALPMAFGLGWILALAPIPAILLLVGPWLVYLLCRVPDQLCEYRNYASLAGMTLLLAPLFDGVWAWVFVLAAFGSWTAFQAFTWSDPLEMWAAATQRYSGDPSRAYGELGAHWKLKGDNWRAEKYLRESIRINPNFGPAMNNLAWVVTELGKPEEGFALMQECVERCPDYALAWEDLGLMKERNGDDPTSCFEKALSLEPRMERSLNKLGLHAFYQKDLDQAAQRFDRALELNPNHFEYVFNRAVVLKHQGEPEKALEWFQRLPRPFPVTPNMIRMEFAQ